MDGRDFFVLLGAIILGLTVIFAPIIGLANYLEGAQCANVAEVMGVEYRYSINIPCMVKVNGQFVPLKAVKAEP